MKKHDSHILYDNKSAKAWQEAYPLGNGSLGAMIFGGTEIERYSLNLDTLWTGVPFGERPLKQRASRKRKYQIGYHVEKRKAVIMLCIR